MVGALHPMPAPASYPDARERIVNTMRHARESNGALPSAYVRSTAKVLGVSERTAWRYAQNGSRRVPRSRHELSEREKELYFEHGGSVAGVRRAMQAEGLETPSWDTLARAFKRAFTPAERAHASGGVEARRQKTVYLRHEPQSINELWEADHVELPVLVIPPGGSHPVKVWWTPMIDGKSRVIPGWALDVQPNAGTVLAALRRSISKEPEMGPGFGKPGTIVWDNALDFLANSVTQVIGVLGINGVPARAYSPTLKGKVERVQRTIQQELIAPMPLNTNGPRRIDGTLADLFEDSAPMSMEELYERVSAWVQHYNYERPHGALGGRTPAQVWDADLHAVEAVPDEDLRFLTTPTEERTISKSGVRWANKDYVAPELHGLVGEVVQIGFVPHDDRQIEVYRDGEFLCKAVPQGTLDDDEIREFIEARRRSNETANTLAGRRNRRSKVRHAPMTTSGTPDLLTTITHDDAREEGVPYRQGAQKKRSKTARPVIAGLNQPVTGDARDV